MYICYLPHHDLRCRPSAPFVGCEGLGPALISGRWLGTVRFYVSLGTILWTWAWNRILPQLQANTRAIGGAGLWAAVNDLGKSGRVLSAIEIGVNSKVGYPKLVTQSVGLLTWASHGAARRNIRRVLAPPERLHQDIYSLALLSHRLFATSHFRRQCWALMSINASHGML